MEKIEEAKTHNDIFFKNGYFQSLDASRQTILNIMNITMKNGGDGEIFFSESSSFT